MTALVEVVGSASMAAVVAGATTVYSIEDVGGYQTFASSSYYTGFVSGSNTPSIVQAPPEDRVVYRILYD